MAIKISYLFTIFLFCILLSANSVYPSPSITGVWVYSDNRAELPGLQKGGSFLTVQCTVSDPLGVPGNIQSVTALSLSTGNVFSLPYNPELGKNYYDRWVAFANQTGIYKITVVNKQGEKAERYSYYFNSSGTLQPLQLPTNIRILNSMSTQPKFVFDPIAGAKAYHFKIHDSTGEVIYSGPISSVPEFIIPEGIIQTNQKYYISPRGLDYVTDLNSPLQRRSVGFMLFSTGKTYALFVGVRDFLGWWECLEGGIGINTQFLQLDTQALAISYYMSKAFKGAYEAIYLTADRTLGHGISRDTLRDEIRWIESKIGTNDRFILYIGAHGNSKIQGTETTQNIGDEYLLIAPWFSNCLNWSSETPQLTDNDLFSFLNTPTLNRVPKWVFLESCHSGGFWGNGNSGDIGDLEKLQNISLFAAAGETQNAGADQEGYGIWAYALIDAFRTNPDGSFVADSNHDGSLSRQEIQHAIEMWTYGNGQHYIGSVAYPLNFGDPYVFTQDTWNPVNYYSSDFIDMANDSNICLQVGVKIKPGDSESSINLNSKGITSVAILSSADFDASMVDPESIEFAEAAATKWHFEDSDGDGKIDLILQFKTSDLKLSINSEIVDISGFTKNNKCIYGNSEIRIVPKKK